MNYVLQTKALPPGLKREKAWEIETWDANVLNQIYQENRPVKGDVIPWGVLGMAKLHHKNKIMPHREATIYLGKDSQKNGVMVQSLETGRIYMSKDIIPTSSVYPLKAPEFKELVKHFNRYTLPEETPPDADPAFKDAVASMMHEAAKKGYDPKNVSFYIPQSSSSGDVDVKEPAENKYDAEHKTRQRELSAKALEI